MRLLNDAAIQILNKKWSNLLNSVPFNSQREQLESMPNLTRQGIEPHYWYKKNSKPKQHLPFEFVAFIRRIILLFLIIAQTYIGSDYLSSLLPYQGWAKLNF